MLKHIDHIDDLPLIGESVQCIDSMFSLINVLDGKPHKFTKISTKYDGAPAIVFGTHPENGRFFVGTKSVFNIKVPKIIYNEDDIQLYYSGDPQLESKLWFVFNSLKRAWEDEFIPNEGVYQGDLMYTADTLIEEGMLIHFKPNTITYSVEGTSELGLQVLNSNVGIVLHTKYVGDSANLRDLKPTSDIDFNEFSGFGIHWIDPTYNVTNKLLNSVQLNIADNLMDEVEGYDSLINNRGLLNTHSETMVRFINHCVRISEPNPSLDMYKVFLRNRGLVAQLNTYDDINVEMVLAQRYMVSVVKNILLNALDKNKLFITSYNNRPCSGEGYVINYHGIYSKLVNRLEFSRNNFANKRFQKTNG